MIKVRNRAGRLLCKVEPKAHLIEIVFKGERTLVVLVGDGSVLVRHKTM
jgi:hypothetical protein